MARKSCVDVLRIGDTWASASSWCCLSDGGRLCSYEELRLAGGVTRHGVSMVFVYGSSVVCVFIGFCRGSRIQITRPRGPHVSLLSVASSWSLVLRGKEVSAWIEHPPGSSSSETLGAFTVEVNKGSSFGESLGASTVMVELGESSSEFM